MVYALSEDSVVTRFLRKLTNWLDSGRVRSSSRRCRCRTGRSRGGRTTWENIVTACSPCNLRKGGRTPDEAGVPLGTEPYRPRWMPPTRTALGVEDIPHPWRDWLPRA